MDKILMMDNHSRHHKSCCMSKSYEESVDHLLLLSEIYRNLWSFVLCLFGVTWVMPRFVTGLLAYWNEHF